MEIKGQTDNFQIGQEIQLLLVTKNSDETYW